jgi:hypothetical protein
VFIRYWVTPVFARERLAELDRPRGRAVTGRIDAEGIEVSIAGDYRWRTHASAMLEEKTPEAQQGDQNHNQADLYTREKSGVFVSPLAFALIQGVSPPQSGPGGATIYSGGRAKAQQIARRFDAGKFTFSGAGKRHFRQTRAS